MPVSYDDYVKKPHLAINYEPWMIREIEKCSTDPTYFFETYVKIQHPDKGKVPFILYPHQKRMLDCIVNNRFIIIKTPRQYGKSSFCAAFILWYTCFHSEKTSGIVSNKQSASIEVLDRLKIMYEALPPWIKPGVYNYAKTMVSFDNGSRIIASATSKDSFRGWTINGICLCDEFCHVHRNKQEAFWSSNYPTVSASKEAKMILISTPLGMYDLFHSIWLKAEKKNSLFNAIDVKWTEHPERDEEWLAEQEEALGKRLFNQEVLCQFLGSTNAAIDAKILEILLTYDISPILIDLNDRLKIYEKPVVNEQYVCGCDIAKGTGEHYSVIQVAKVLSVNPFKLEQVAVFRDNFTDVYEFGDIIYKVALYYNNARLMIENNAEGSAIVNKIWWDHEYENLVNESSKSTGLGIRATRSTKPKAVIMMKKLIENGDLILKDITTINELTTFVEDKNNIFRGKDGVDDDLVSALYWLCYIANFDVFTEDISINTKVNDDGWGILTEYDEIMSSY